MKNLLILLFTILSINVIAKNKKKASYVKLNKTSCYGKCPTYEVNIFSNGTVKYIGKANVKILREVIFQASPNDVKDIFAIIDNNKILNLPAFYEKKISDFPSKNLTFIINKQTKKVNNVDDGPDFLKNIANKIDNIWFTYQEKNIPEEEQIHESPKEVESPKSKIFAIVEQMPEYIGGESEMNNYINQKLDYPKVAKESSLEGKVICNFIINEDGSISNIIVEKGLSKECDDEAIRVIKSMPKWKPGKQNGKPVKTYFNLPINFKLQ